MLTLPSDERAVSDAFTDVEYQRARKTSVDFFSMVVRVRRAHERDASRLSRMANNTGLATWLFGDSVGPTLLDALAHPAVTHMREFHHLSEPNLEELKDWAGIVAQTPCWGEVMHGRSTLWSRLEDGPVDNFEFF
jgi:hypothetical protein